MEANTVTLPARGATVAFGNAIERLRARLRGGVLLPETDGYDYGAAGVERPC